MENIGWGLRDGHRRFSMSLFSLGNDQVVKKSVNKSNQTITPVNKQRTMVAYLMIALLVISATQLKIGKCFLQ